VKRTRFDNAPCPIARSTDLMGDWWTPVVMREAFLGCQRFEQFEERLQLSRNTLTQRLARLVEEGMLKRVLYQERPPRYEYVLTDKGRAFWDVLAAMWRFGEDWLFTPESPPPLKLTRAADGRDVRYGVIDTVSGERVEASELRIRRRKSSPTS
jgi:DNA-binding HxlR family transcriptional regulator